MKTTTRWNTRNHTKFYISTNEIKVEMRLQCFIIRPNSRYTQRLFVNVRNDVLNKRIIDMVGLISKYQQNIDIISTTHERLQNDRHNYSVPSFKHR